MTALLTSGLVFLALAAIAFALFGKRQPRLAGDSRLRALGGDDIKSSGEDVRETLLRNRDSNFLALRNSSWFVSIALELRQANVHLRVGEYMLLRLLLAAALAFGPLLWQGASLVALSVAVLACTAGFMLPALYVKTVRRSRLEKIDQQLIELLPSLASSLRSGFAFEQSIQAAAEQVAAPLADELRVLLNDVSLGATMPDALRDLNVRVGSMDLDIAITAVLVHRTTGGNLAEVLDQVAETLRERERIRGDIQTFTAQQRLTGSILSVYPLVVGLVLLAILPAVWSKLFTTPVGQVQLVIALGLQLIGFVAIRRTLRLEV